MPAVSPELLIALAVVVVASVGFVVLGNVYRWDVLAPGYVTGSRILGVCALLAFAAVSAYARRAQPLTAALIVAAGAVTAAGYFALHRSLVRRIRASMERPHAGE